jgi:cytochrome c oxidase subunit 4
MVHPTPRVYYVVFAALLVLLVLTVIAPRITHTAGFAIALAIATSKAALIMLFFMHVRYSSPLIRLVAVAGLFWLGIMLGLTISDYATRDHTVDTVPSASLRQ